LAEAGGAVLFAIDDGLDDAVDVGGGDGFGGGQGLDELTDDAVAIGRLEFGENGFLYYEIRQLHERPQQNIRTQGVRSSICDLPRECSWLAAEGRGSGASARPSPNVYDCEIALCEQ